MFHANTETVIHDWAQRRGEWRAPARTDIEPAALKHLLPQLFILGCEAEDAAAFRLAGGLLTDLHGRDLRGACFYSLFFGADRAVARETLTAARLSGEPVVLNATGWTAGGEEAHLEIVLAPLIGPSGEMDRVLGLYQPTTSLRRLMGAKLEALTLDDTRKAAPKRQPRLRLVALNGERLD